MAQAKERIGGSVEAEYEYQVGYPSEMILSAAEKSGAGMIVMGSRAFGITELLTWQCKQPIVHYAKVPVVIVKIKFCCAVIKRETIAAL